MTVNERLYNAGLHDAWDNAVINRDRSRMIEILMATDIAKPQGERTADAVLANPQKYGY